LLREEDFRCEREDELRDLLLELLLREVERCFVAIVK